MSHERPYMNGAAGRLYAIRHALSEIAVQRGAMPESVIKQLHHLIEDLRGIEQLADPEAWRLLGGIDLPFLKEMLAGVDESLLVEAIRDGGQPMIVKLLEAIEKAKNECP